MTCSSGPKVSVLVALFGSSRYVEGCIEGLRRQTYGNFETVFVVDGRTTEDAEAVGRSSGGLRECRTVVLPPGEGLAGARNAGLDGSDGEIVWFLDVDDRPYPTFLEELVGLMGSTGADMVFCNHFQEPEGHVPEIPERSYPVRTYTRSEALERFAELPMYSWSRIQRRSVFDEETRFRDLESMEDMDQTLRSLTAVSKVCYYGKPLYIYRKSSSGAAARMRGTEAASACEIYRGTVPLVKERCPEAHEKFRTELALRTMRQATFVRYGLYREFSRWAVVREIADFAGTSAEARVFRASKTLYYILMLPFSHWVWDRKTGLWDKNVRTHRNRADPTMCQIRYAR